MACVGRACGSAVISVVGICSFVCRSTFAWGGLVGCSAFACASFVGGRPARFRPDSAAIYTRSPQQNFVSVKPSHAAAPPFLPSSTGKLFCRSAVNDLVVAPQSTALYVLLRELCFTQGQLSHLRESIWKADLAHVSDGGSTTNSAHAPEGQLVSYWWPFGAVNGSAVHTPAIQYAGANDTVSMADMSATDVTRAGDRIPMDDVEWTDVRRFPPGGDPDIKDIGFTSQSFSSDERCLYFVDYENLRVWGLDPLTSAGTANPPVLIAGSGSRGVVDADGLTSSFNNITDMAVSPDGCNIFVVDYWYNSLRWLQLDSPCSAARRVLTLESFPGGPRAVRLGQSGNDYYLYVGMSDGSVTEIQINASQLHSCAPAPPPSPPRSYPSAGPPADSNVRSPDSSLPSSAFSPSPPFPTKPGRTRYLALIVALPLSTLAVLGAAACASYLILHKKAQPMTNLRTNGSGESTVATTGSSWGVAGGKDELGGGPGGERQEGLHHLQVKQFSFAALSYCTQNFSESYRIGPGGAFGNVYWGSLDDGKELAMKVMTGDLTEGKRKMFLAEVNTLSRVHHANLIRLVGFCLEGNRSILVYPYFPGGSLFARLHERGKAVPGKASMPPLTLVERMCTALQIAKGLAYLHEGADPPVVHRDIKSSNVLLGDGSGEKLHVVVADFGLATMGERVFGTERESVVKTSHMAGTFGYMAPEYVRGGILSDKNDVYAFGVILLELLTGRKAVAMAPSGVGWETLPDWARPFLQRMVVVGNDTAYQILDARLHDQAAGFRFSRMVSGTLLLASECIREDYRTRPSMCGLVEKIGNLLNEVQIDVRQAKR
ncbi:hypothetical protein CBR_g78806 [Chara braunii]|uniref:Protein kinase domain-containing protein n=1 Tax=Chara braunii TaxID=69332 RepID=A0A388KAH3_CHABU|nr:hypothetical protein CBR_g78806 [Chara braunii]|eukprot:GBG67027.1 hypothetical protein CBR_g78806 [Chara braunii]